MSVNALVGGGQGTNLLWKAAKLRGLCLWYYRIWVHDVLSVSKNYYRVGVNGQVLGGSMIKHVPPYRPDSPPKMMLVGEAPSNVEEAKGMPFVGPVGRVLDMLLRSAHINRWDAWLTNAIDFKLPGNEVEKLPRLLTRKEALAYTGPA